MSIENVRITAEQAGIAPTVANKLLALFDSTPGLARVWIYGSRARGDFRPASDIDLLVDLPETGESPSTKLWGALDDLGLIYRNDLTRWQDKLADDFRARIQRDRRLFWEPKRAPAGRVAGAIELKPFQETVLARLADYLAEMQPLAAQSAKNAEVLRVMEGMDDALREAEDYPKRTWAALKKRGLLPAAPLRTPRPPGHKCCLGPGR